MSRCLGLPRAIQRMGTDKRTPRALVRWLLCGVLLMGCAEGTPTATPPPTLTASTPAAADTVTAFIGALNQRNYPVTFDLLDPASQAVLGNPDQLRKIYAEAISAATALNTTTRMNGWA